MLRLSIRHFIGFILSLSARISPGLRLCAPMSPGFSLSPLSFAILSAARSFPHWAKLLTMHCGGCLRRTYCRFCKNGAKTFPRNAVSHGPRLAPPAALETVLFSRSPQAVLGFPAGMLRLFRALHLLLSIPILSDPIFKGVRGVRLFPWGRQAGQSRADALPLQQPAQLFHNSKTPSQENSGTQLCPPRRFRCFSTLSPRMRVHADGRLGADAAACVFIFNRHS